MAYLTQLILGLAVILSSMGAFRRFIRSRLEKRRSYMLTTATLRSTDIADQATGRSKLFASQMISTERERETEVYAFA